MAELRVGDPLDEATFCGAVNSRPHYDKVEHESIESVQYQLVHCKI